MNIYKSYCEFIHKLHVWLQPQFIIKKAYPEANREYTDEEKEQNKLEILTGDKDKTRKKLEELLSQDIGYVHYEHYQKQTIEESYLDVFNDGYKKVVNPTIDVLVIEMGSELETYMSIEDDEE